MRFTETQSGVLQVSHKSSLHRIAASPLLIAFGDDLPCNVICGPFAGGVMRNHINATTRCLWQPFQELHIDFRIMDANKGKGHERATSKMLAHKPVDGLSILEAVKKIGQTIRLIIQRKHDLVNERKGSTA
jgi:hypothetical protein